MIKGHRVTTYIISFLIINKNYKISLELWNIAEFAIQPTRKEVQNAELVHAQS